MREIKDNRVRTRINIRLQSIGHNIAHYENMYDIYARVAATIWRYKYDLKVKLLTIISAAYEKVDFKHSI